MKKFLLKDSWENRSINKRHEEIFAELCPIYSLNPHMYTEVLEFRKRTYLRREMSKKGHH